MAEIVWTPKALDDLESLLDYNLEGCPGRGPTFRAKLVSRVEILDRYPLLGGFVANDPGRVYREFGKAITAYSIAPMAGWCTL